MNESDRPLGSSGASPEIDMSSSRAVIRALALLRSLGWQELSAEQTRRLREGELSEVLLRPILEERIRLINLLTSNTSAGAVSSQALRAAIDTLQHSPHDDLVYANASIWSILRTGASVPLHSDDTSVGSSTLRFIDFDKPENNLFHVVRGFEVIGPDCASRIDLTLFVNGIPLVVVGCSDSSEVLEATITRVRNLQHLRKGVPNLFHFVQLLVATAADRAAYGMVGSGPELWTTWQETPGAPAALRTLLRGSGSFEPFSVTEAESEIAMRLANEQDRLLHALCRPGRLLDLVRWFTFFQSGRRCMARYYQYFAVQAALSQVSRPEVDARRPGGLIGQAQGSGKTVTLVMLANVLLEIFHLHQPRIVIVTDRAALDDELQELLRATGIDCRQPSTGNQLRKLLLDNQTRAICTVIQKFTAAINMKAPALDSPHIFVLIDEAQRTQAGQLHNVMRSMLRRACLIEFSGLPLLARVAQLKEATDNLLAVYSFEDALRDGVLLSVQWQTKNLGAQESRVGLEEQLGDSPDGTSTDHMLGSTPRRLELHEDEPLLSTLSELVARDFLSVVNSNSSLKGQLIVPTAAAALRLQHLLGWRGVSSEVGISLSSSDGARAPEIEDFRQRMLQKFGSEDRYEADLLRRFSDGPAPNLLLVVDPFWPGKAVARNAVMYIARPLRAPALFHAVTQINRPHSHKLCGRIVDYVNRPPDLSYPEKGFLSLLRSAGVISSTVADDASLSEEPLQTPVAEVSQELKCLGLSQQRLLSLTQACETVLQEEFERQQLLQPASVLHRTADGLARAMVAAMKVDWSLERAAKARIMTGMEDQLFELQSVGGIGMSLDTIDTILERCMDVAIHLH